MNASSHRFLFIFILILAFILRFYKLGEIPNGLYQDETAIGYNAYSILNTNRDEYGSFMPLYFKSFGDYKLPIYVYATVPSVLLFGLTPFSVRLPSAFFGLLTVPFFYLLVRQLSNNKLFAIIAMGLMAINPWHIHYNRATFEVSISLFLFVVGTLFLYDAYFKNKKGFFFLGTICFIMCMYTYNITRLLSPLLFIFTNFIFYDKTSRLKKTETIFTLVVSFILLFPFLKTLTSPGGFTSSSGTLIFSSAAVQAPLLEFRSYMIALPHSISKLFFNSFILTMWQFVYNISAYISLPFFFFSGSSHGNHGIETMGQFYLFELPLIFIGAGVLIKHQGVMTKILSLWFLGTIVIASLTYKAPHATRSFFLLIPMTIASAQGLLVALSFLKRQKNNTRLAYVSLGVILVLFNFVWYLSSYYIRFPVAYAKSWRSQDASLVEYIDSHIDLYDKVLVDKNSGFIYTSYLFYTGYEPSEFQVTSRRQADDSEGFSEVLAFGKFEIRDIDWEVDINTPRTLIISSAEGKPIHIPSLINFYYPERPVVVAHKQKILQYPTEDIAYTVIETKSQ